MEPVVASYKWTLDELIRAARAHSSLGWKGWLVLVLHIVAGGNLLLGILILYPRIRAETGISFSVFLILTSSYWFFSRLLLRPWLVRRSFVKRPDRNQEVRWSLDPDRITISNDVADSEVKWAVFHRVAVTRDGLLFYVTDRLYHWLPRSGVAEKDYPRLIELVRSKVERFSSVPGRRQ